MLKPKPEWVDITKETQQLVDLLDTLPENLRGEAYARTLVQTWGGDVRKVYSLLNYARKIAVREVLNKHLHKHYDVLMRCNTREQVVIAFRHRNLLLRWMYKSKLPFGAKSTAQHILNSWWATYEKISTKTLGDLD